MPFVRVLISTALVLTLGFTLICCGNESSSSENPPVMEPRQDSGLAKKRLPTDPEERRRLAEEQRRRAEAVRRASIELATRGIQTDGYLMNLIAEDEVYRVAFVKQAGRDLRAEITVRIRQSDFEILGVDQSSNASE